MTTLTSILGLALLFVVFGAFRMAERRRHCSGREDSGRKRCGACPLRVGDGELRGPCPGSRPRE